MKYIILPFILILTTIVLLGCTEQLPPEEGFEDDQVIAGQAVSGGGGIIGEKVDNCKKESDGNSIFYQGTLTYSNKGKEYGPYTDKCYKNKLLEYSCTNNKVARKWVNCPEGGECKDGACIGPCTDTDEGKNFQEKGTVKGWSTLGQLGSKTDFCINKTTELSQCNIDKSNLTWYYSTVWPSQNQANASNYFPLYNSCISEKAVLSSQTITKDTLIADRDKTIADAKNKLWLYLIIAFIAGILVIKFGLPIIQGRGMREQGGMANPTGRY